VSAIQRANRTSRRYALTLAVLAIATMSYGMLTSLILPALTTVERSLGTSAVSGGWILTAYLISATVTTPVAGRLGDMYGKKRLLLVVLGVLCLGCLLSAVAKSLALMLIGRVLQGAVGGVFPLSFAIIRDEFPEDRVEGAIGLIAAIVGLGGGFGIVLAGPIVENLSTAWLFWVPLGLAAAAAIATWLWIPESAERSPGRVDFYTTALLSAWLTTLLLAITNGPTWGWLNWRLFCLLAASAMGVVLWVRRELSATQPLIDIRTLLIPAVWLTNVASLLLGFGMLSAYVLVPDFVQTPPSAGYGFGSSVTRAGIFLVPSNVLMLAIGVSTGMICRRIGAKRMLAIGALLSAVAFAVLAVEHGKPIEFYLDAVILGAGIGFSYAAMSNVIVGAVPQSQTGAATGVNINARTFGSALGSSVVVTILESKLSPGAFPPADRYVTAFLVCLAALLVAFVVALAIPAPLRDRPRAQAFGISQSIR
jgi:MFS family permease